MANPFSVPHSKNFCGGNFQDWLEVNIIDKCNGRCTWCVEKYGIHPKHHADWKTICNVAIATEKRNVILLGGEPTLHPDFSRIANYLAKHKRNVWATTNGSLLTRRWVRENMGGVCGINISIHNYDFAQNYVVTGIQLNEHNIIRAISELRAMKIKIRFNCNCIKGQIDSVEKIYKYIYMAIELGADSIRFSELKHDNKNFVDLAKLLEHKYGLNSDPYRFGCNQNVTIEGMPINFRQMCGMQTNLRPCPKNPKIIKKQVLYYDGKIYDGWQQKRGPRMTKEELIKLLFEVQDETKTIADAVEVILNSVPNPKSKESCKECSRIHYYGSSCQY